ncbi:lipid A 3-O-deacylase [Bosea sp. OAE506]|uniref:acyloxyacyl hydrolase n=1 Tax=Bosea sp. OAE506 TaxID=2663870 RepID=UPI003396C855
MSGSLAFRGAGAGPSRRDLELRTGHHASTLPLLGSPHRRGRVANPGGSRESGLANFSGEIATPRPFTLSDRFANAFVPRFHLGASANFNGTRFAYAGATWTVDLTRAVFVEASLGAALNDGKTGAVIPENRLNLGCNTGTREAAALGVRLNDRWSLVATLEHFSTAGCSDRTQPKGPANIGARLGYSF